MQQINLAQLASYFVTLEFDDQCFIKVDIQVCIYIYMRTGADPGFSEGRSKYRGGLWNWGTGP